MKTFRATRGPFSERPHYELQEIDRICVDELRGVDCFPVRPEAIRIDRFLEKRFGIAAEYLDLDEGVLGYTKFGAKGPVAVVISRALDEEGTMGANRRVRTTLAHEAGHILLQGHLFGLAKGTASLFQADAGITSTQILCRQGAPGGSSAPGYGYDGKWWEYQANRAIGALLLPRPLVLMHLEPFLIAQGSFGIKILDPRQRAEAQSSVVQTFDVNPAAARLRLVEIWPEEPQFRL